MVHTHRIGAHTSTAGALENAAILAHAADGNTAQIFSGSPRQWRNPLPSKAAVEKLRAARERLDVNPLVIHSNYLINLASIDPSNRANSVIAFRGELERALTIGAEYLVLHPGSYKGQTLEESLDRFAEGLEEASRGIDSTTLTLLLENTAGAGAAIGSRFEELAALRERSLNRVEYAIGYCIDTCHTLVAGFDYCSESKMKSLVADMDAILGLERIPVFHMNDSKGECGSRLDRHEHIGHGKLGLEPFERILNHPKLSAKTFILETPVDEPDDMARNIAALRGLCKPATVATRSPAPRKARGSRV
ncbi:MAG TPA: deoxyribonuclease IV [Bryobacteraceae bacterium]|nr:deoxyribonuclease IV [Bryobacteraceae bacterium]